MHYLPLAPVAALFLALGSFAQEAIYRCGNEYTNTVPEAQKANCKLVQGGNVTSKPSARQFEHVALG